MDIPKPDGGDYNRGTKILLAMWILTGLTAIILGIRYVVKAWVYIRLPKISSPGRIWGLEDVLFGISFALDIVHVSVLQTGYHWGLGRHFFYLTGVERVNAMKWQFASEPLSISATTLSRTGMMWFLYQCFGRNGRKMQPWIIALMVIHASVNIVTILQIVLQCGPNPYHVSNRFSYFHYLWEGLPADGSVVCEAPTIQTNIGYFQGAINTSADFIIAVIANYEIWQFFISGLKRNPNKSWMTQFWELDPKSRNQRVWQSLVLSGPVVISGIASIVKTALLGAVGDKMDMTWNVIVFELWVKIENYSIDIAACAPVMRTFFKFVINKPSKNGGYGASSDLPTYGNSSHVARPISLSAIHSKGGFDRMGSTDDLNVRNDLDGKSVSNKSDEEISYGSSLGKKDIVVTQKVVVTSREMKDDDIRADGSKAIANGWYMSTS